MMYLQANVGRNVGTEPATEANWSACKATVADAICSAIRQLNDVPRSVIKSRIETHTGMGAWGELDPEESAHISIISEWSVDVELLRSELALIARMFNQDAIALIVGSELISA